MEFKLLMPSIFFVVVFAFGQDTLLGEADHRSRNKLTICCEANLTILEVNMKHKLRETERRLTRRMDDKIRFQNQSASIFHLERLFHHVNEELQITKENEERQTDIIKHLRAQVTRQQHEIHHTKNNMERLRKTVENLSILVEELISLKSSEPATAGEGLMDKLQTTPAPFRAIFPIDCQDVYKNGGMKYPGYYYIMVQPYLSPEPFKVCCRMTNNSGWTLVQRRQDGSVDFYRSWAEYKRGFGSLEDEFWLGNDHLYQLTNQGDYKLRIEMQDWADRNFWVEYDHFRVSDENDNYRLHVHGYHGTAGDSMTSHWENHDGQAFSTKDKDNDERFYDNCAEHYHGAWWFKSCFESHLNGIYYHKGSHNNYFVRNGIQWNSIHLHSSLKVVTMMIKPNNGVTEEDELSNGIS